VVVYPLFYTAGLSFFDVNLLQPARARFVGLGNYAEMIGSGAFWHSLLITFLYTFGTVIASLLLGLGTALLLNREYRLRSVTRPTRRLQPFDPFARDAHQSATEQLGTTVCVCLWW
jgi:ABC-type sugar transport system permease subunit